MTFKNQKEEVMEIELTSYGKHLLSKGKFRPSFYAFFDDDVLYDAEYTGEAEVQNNAQKRILEETPRTRVQVNYSGAETAVAKQIESARVGKKDLKGSFQTTREKHYSLSAPLGNSTTSSDYAPSWDVTLYGGEFTEQKRVKTGDHQTTQIPQMEVKDSVYETFITKKQQTQSVSNVFDANFEVYDNGNSIEIDHDDFIIEIDELHTDSMKENYDIEVFIIEEDTVGSDIVETLIPLSFKKQHSGNVINGILVEESEKRKTIRADDTYVEYYLDIDIDTDIRKDRLCELGYSTDFSKRGYIKVDCKTEKKSPSRMDAVYEELEQNLSISGDDC